MKKQHIVFILFLLTLFGKNILFHTFAFDGAMPWGAWQYYAAKLCVAVCIASFVYISRRPWWTLAVLLIVDIWGIANWLYFRANGMFVSLSMLGFAGNLNGFGNSVTSYLDWRALLFLLPTWLYAALLFFLRDRQERRWVPFAISLVVGVLLVMADNTLIHVVNKQKGHDYGRLTVQKMLPFFVSEHRMLFDWEAQYSLLRDHSIIGYLPLHLVYEHKLNNYRQKAADTFTEEEQDLLMHCLQPDSAVRLQPNSHLVLVLVESLESWPLYYEGITPHINRLAHDRHSLFADKVKSQARHGISGDGQLTLNTGLLPLQLGVACILFATNEYPNIAHLYPRSSAINPTKGTWNTTATMPAYGYRELIEAEHIAGDAWNDLDICREAKRWLLASDTLSCSLVMTFSSHSPFTRIRGNVPAITDDTPDDMRRYLTCIHYADSCIGLLLDSLEAHGRLDNTTIVITGDHAIFHESERQLFMPYAQAHNLPITATDLFIPLIIYSPHADGPTEISDLCYQMDIYPTVLRAIGCEGYAWKGLGADLYDPDARANRLLSEDEAYRLSDKIIRNNWFEKRLTR